MVRRLAVCVPALLLHARVQPIYACTATYTSSFLCRYTSQGKSNDCYYLPVICMACKYTYAMTFAHRHVVRAWCSITRCSFSQRMRAILDMQDSAGNAATPGIRHVYVACLSLTVLCTASDGSLYCSTSSGLCIPSVTAVATPAPSYPSITLIGQAVLGFTQGTSYLACPTPQPTDVICDRSGWLVSACFNL